MLALDARTGQPISTFGHDGVVDLKLNGLPAGFQGPRVFAIVKLDGLRVFSILVDADPDQVAIGRAVRLSPLKIADGR